MKAPDIRYHRPDSLDEALETLSDATTEYQALAGGQSLLPMVHLRMAFPEVLLDLNRLTELQFIRYSETETEVEIGAMVRYTELLNSAIVQQDIPLFTRALPHIAHQAIRNRGTIGGSIALADPAAEMPALLIALGARIKLMSSRGSREIAAEEFFLGVYETLLETDELVHTIIVPKNSPKRLFGFYELARRHGDYAMAGVAVTADSVEPYAGLKIVFFSVGEKALRAHDSESALNGSNDADSIALERGLSALSTLEFHEDMNASHPVKAHLARVVLKRALQQMCEGIV